METNSRFDHPPTELDEITIRKLKTGVKLGWIGYLLVVLVSIISIVSAILVLIELSRVDRTGLTEEQMMELSLLNFQSVLALISAGIYILASLILIYKLIGYGRLHKKPNQFRNDMRTIKIVAIVWLSLASILLIFNLGNGLLSLPAILLIIGEFSSLGPLLGTSSVLSVVASFLIVPSLVIIILGWVNIIISSNNEQKIMSNFFTSY